MIGFVLVMRERDLEEAARVPEALHVHQDQAHRRVVLPEQEQVVAADVGLVADRDELRNADAVLARVVEHAEPECAPDCDTKAAGPNGGIVVANVAFIATAGSVFTTPMQFGPIMRMPCRRTISMRRVSRSAPSPPISRKPAEMTTSPRTFAAPHSSAMSSTCSLGTTMTAMSHASGTSAIERCARAPSRSRTRAD